MTDINASRISAEPVTCGTGCSCSIALHKDSHATALQVRDTVAHLLVQRRAPCHSAAAGYRGSTYFYKDRGGKLMMGPVWDYNEAFGICCGYPIEGWDKGGVSGPGQSGGSAISPEGWRFNICNEPGDAGPPVRLAEGQG